MKENIKKGFGFGIGYILGVSLVTTIAKSLNDAIEESKKKDQSDSSTKEGEA